MAERLRIPGMRHPAPKPLPKLDATRPPSSIVAWALYVDGVKADCPDLNVATRRAREGEGFLWLGLKDPTNKDMSAFARSFDLHPLAIEDAVEGHTRSKVEQFQDTLFAVISTVAYVEHDRVTETSEIVSTGQIMVFAGKSFVLTVRRGEHSPLRELRTKLEANPERLAQGPSTVLYGVMDKIIDDYIDTVNAFEKDIEDAEEVIFGRQGTKEIDRVYQLKRELIEFKRCVVPLGPPLAALATREFAAIPASARAYFRELSDHHQEAREAIQAFDEVLATILQAGLARASVADNQDMRKISAAVALLAVPTTIAAIYGMNFENMPELSTRYGYFVVMGVILLIMLGLYLGFRKNRWL